MVETKHIILQQFTLSVHLIILSFVKGFYLQIKIVETKHNVYYTLSLDIPYSKRKKKSDISLSARMKSRLSFLSLLQNNDPLNFFFSLSVHFPKRQFKPFPCSVTPSDFS